MFNRIRHCFIHDAVRQANFLPGWERGVVHSTRSFEKGVDIPVERDAWDGRLLIGDEIDDHLLKLQWEEEEVEALICKHC